MEGLRLKYFVLKPAGDDMYSHASRLAMLTYADTIKNTNPTLACDIIEWAREEEKAEICRRNKYNETEI